MKLKGIYLVSEEACMNPNAGAWKHIQIGLKELSKRFDMTLWSPYEYVQQPPNESASKKELKSSVIKDNLIWGALKDIKIRSERRKAVRELSEILEKEHFDFIYERTAYLSLEGGVLARKFGLKHILETNGVQSLDIKDHYSSLLNAWAARKEVRSYELADLVCFVGGQAEYMGYRKDNYISIENGIAKSDLGKYKRDNKLNNKTHLLFLGHKIPHHNFEIVKEALQYMKLKERVCLHLIGSNFESEMSILSELVETVYHGSMTKAEIMDTIGSFHIGLITGGRAYNSFMKLPEYAAAHLAVVAPNLQNLRTHFTENEIAYFNNEDSKSLAQVLDMLVVDHTKRKQFAEQLSLKIEKSYCWEDIYSKVSDEISVVVGGGS